MSSTTIIKVSIVVLLAFAPISFLIWGPSVFFKILPIIAGPITALWSYAIWKKKRQRIKNLQDARDALLEWRYEKDRG